MAEEFIPEAAATEEDKYKDVAITQENLEKQDSLLAKLIARMDSESEAEAQNAFEKARRKIDIINYIFSQLYNEKLGIGFAEIYRRATGDNHAEEIEQLKKQNEELWVANENYAIIEAEYKKRLDDVDAYIAGEITRLLSTNDSPQAKKITELSEIIRRISDELLQKDYIIAQKNADLDVMRQKFDSYIDNLPANVVGKYFDDGQSSFNVKYSDGNKACVWTVRSLDGVNLLVERYSNAKLHGKRVQRYPNNALACSENYLAGQLHGDRKLYWPDSKRKEISEWSFGKLHGVQKIFNANGKIQEDSHWRMGQRHGIYNVFYENGNPKQKSNWKNDTLDGIYLRFKEDGIKLEESNWKDGALHGQKEIFYDNGIPQEQSYWSAGLQDGKTNLFYNNGIKLEESNWKDGALHGQKEIFYDNGIPQEQSYWSAGLQDGKTNLFYNNGIKREQQIWEKGQQYGKWLYYYPDGSKSSSKEWQADLLHGLSVSYREDGTFIEKRNWHEGRLHGMSIIYGKNNHICQKLPYWLGTLHGTREIFYDSSLPKEISEWRGDKLDGLTKKFYPAGNLEEESEWHENMLHGTRTLFQSNGKQKEETTWYEGRLDGACKFFDNDGILSEESEWKDDVRHGACTFHVRNDEIVTRIVSTYVAGSKNGEEVHYDASDKVVSKFLYQNDTVVKQEDYYQSGQLKLSASFENGILHGPRLQYREDGLPISVENYDNGKPSGLCYEYKDNNMVERVSHVNGESHGLCVYCYDNGVIKDALYFNYGGFDHYKSMSLKRQLLVTQFGDVVKELFIKDKRQRTPTQRALDQIDKLRFNQ